MSFLDETIVVFSYLPWNFPADFIKQTSLELAKKARVVVFSPVGFPTLRNLATDQEKRRDWLSLLAEKRVTYFPSLGILPFQRLEFVRRLNIRLNLVLFRIFYRLRFGGKKPIFWIFSPQELPRMKDFFRWAKLLIYDRVDQIASPDPKDYKTRKQEDKAILKIADYIFNISPYSLRYAKKYNKQVFLVPCGFNADLFFKKKISEPGELKKIKRPIIGFVGNTDHRLNFGLIHSLATRRKDWSFVFVGNYHFEEKKLNQLEIPDLGKEFKRLKVLPNIYFIGKKPKNRMPDFISSFAACLIPYDTSQEFVRGANPLKLYEYLAMGRPVVSVPIEAVKRYRPIVEIASDARGFERKIEKFLKKAHNRKDEEKRRKIAWENSWQVKVNKMWQIVRQ